MDNGTFTGRKKRLNSPLTKNCTPEPPWDENDLVNNGVLNDQWVFSSSTPTPIRRVTYQDPISGKTYKFLTNEMNLSPGLIAFIYRSRWNIEKVFDETKNKLGEAKAWGKSKASKEQQACFITMAYNLLILLEQRIEKCSGIIDFKTMIKRDNRKMKEIDFIVESDKAINPLLLSIDFATQRSLQFIRWLRSQLITILGASPEAFKITKYQNSQRTKQASRYSLILKRINLYEYWKSKTKPPFSH